MRTVTLAAVLGLSLVACRSDNNSNNNGPDSGNGSGSGGGAVKIQDVQNDAMAPGTSVSLHNVVVTAIDTYGAKTGDFWVEEMEGGAFSGIHVFKAQTSDVAMLAVGDVVDISGAVKSEFALSTDTTGRTVTELEPPMGGQMTVTKTGSGMMIQPQVVDALAIGMMADPARSMEWEKWEGVLITVNNVSALSSPKQIGGSMPDTTLQSFGITGVAKAESSLAAFPMGIARNTCLASVTGVVDYFFDYLILPRATTEVATGTTGCPALESSAQVCEDNTDNDGNGFSDCADLNCVVGDNTCRTATKIMDIDTATTLPTGGVEVGSNENVYVTAIAKNGRDFWVAMGSGANPKATANEGLYVFSGGQAAPMNLAIGAHVDIVGTLSAYNNDMNGNALTELNELQTTIGTGPVTIGAATGLLASALTVDATGKPWIGSLVTLANVAVVDAGTSANHGVGHLKQGGITFESLPDIIGGTGLAATEVGKCYSSITGIWSYDVYSNMYGLIPLAAGSTTGNPTCN